jgi:hypothetical protein
MIEIQSGIPIPEINRNPHTQRHSKYPWHTMNVGDSFFVPNVTVKGFAGTAYSAGKRHGRTYVARTVDGGVRVWRTA